MNHKCDIVAKIPYIKTVTLRIQLNTPCSYSQYFRKVPTIYILGLRCRKICVFKLLLSHLQDIQHEITL